MLNDIKDAFTTLLEKSNKHPALLVIYAFIDICAALANVGGERSNQKVFVSYLDQFMLPGTKRAISPAQLWAARSALLHTFSPLGHHTGPGRSPPTFYFSGDENREVVRRSLESRGYIGFALVAISDIQSIAIWTFNGMISRLEQDTAFRDGVLKNAEHLLLAQNALAVERFLSFAETLTDSSDADPPAV